jgi:hypothetical protein
VRLEAGPFGFELLKRGGGIVLFVVVFEAPSELEGEVPGD